MAEHKPVFVCAKEGKPERWVISDYHCPLCGMISCYSKQTAKAEYIDAYMYVCILCVQEFYTFGHPEPILDGPTLEITKQLQSHFKSLIHKEPA